jgi:hypothetical protein
MAALRAGWKPALLTSEPETEALRKSVQHSPLKRFFKSDEDPLDQHFGLDFPESAGTFRILGVVRVDPVAVLKEE